MNYAVIPVVLQFSILIKTIIAFEPVLQSSKQKYANPPPIRFEGFNVQLIAAVDILIKRKRQD